MNSGFRAILDFFESSDRPCTANAELLTVQTVVEEGGVQLPLQVVMHPGNCQVRLATPLPMVFAAAERLAAAELCARASAGWPLGHFDLDLETGEVAFRSSAQFPADSLGEAILDPLVEAHRTVACAYYPAFRGMHEKRLAPQDALSLVSPAVAPPTVNVSGDGGLRYDVSLEPDDHGNTVVYGMPAPSTRGLRTVAKMFQEAGLEFEQDYKHYAIQTGFRVIEEERRFTTTFSVGPGDNIFEGRTLLAENLTAEQCRLLPELCVRITHHAIQGSFKCDLDAGRLYFHSGVPYPPGSLHHQVINHYLGVHVMCCMQFDPGISAVLRDGQGSAFAAIFGLSRQELRPHIKFDYLQW